MELQLKNWLRNSLAVAYTAVFATICAPVAAQNLVPNASFEDTLSCPSTFDQLNSSSGWYDAGGNYSSPDYLNVCDPTSNNVGVPNNWYGHQLPSTGNGYASLVTYSPLQFDSVREILGVQLLSQLNIGVKYYVSLQANLALKQGQATYATDNLGFLFSTFPYTSSNPAPISNFAHYSSTTVVTDTLNWIRIFGSFTADSAYTHVSIGNFFDSTNTNSTVLFGPSMFIQEALYYIDDVCVSTDSLTCYNFVGIEEHTDQNQIKLYPNPANEVVYIESDEPIERVELYDLMGRLVGAQSDAYRVDISHLVTGIYLMKIKTANGIAIKKFVKE